jgi:hypothetical protein
MDNCNNKSNVTVTSRLETLHYRRDYPPTFNDLVRLGSQRFYGHSEPPQPLHEFRLHRVPNARENPLAGKEHERKRESLPYVLSLCEIPLHSHYFALVTKAAYDEKTGECDLLISRSHCIETRYKLCVAGGGAE